jgi:hypothetical protein
MRETRALVALAVAAAVVLPGATRAVDAASVPPAAKHRIGVRVVGGAGELFDRRTGRRFVPRGANYVRLDASGHSTFNVGRYRAAAAEAFLARMRGLGYNAARVFVAGECASGCAGASGGGISRAYVRNVTDFLRRAKRHGVVVILTTGFLPPSYASRIGDSPLVDDVNRIVLTAGGIGAYQQFWRDLVLELRRQRAPLDVVLAYDVVNELAFVANAAPFTLGGGVLRAPDGRTYDLADAAAKERLLGDGLVTFGNRVRTAIRRVDPTALVAASFFQPEGPNPTRAGDVRVLRTAAVIHSSALDFVDLHAYPGFELTLAQYMQNFGVSGPTRKPLLLGEFGAFKEPYPSAADAAASLEAWQAASCAYGLDGWLLWTWDTHEQPELWNGLSDGGAIARRLSPRTRPDPCAAPSGPRNLALGKPAAASAAAETPPASAVDGNPGTIWSSGADPPQWLEVDLGAPETVGRVRLRVAQFPNGPTIHRVYTKGPEPSSPYMLRAELAGSTVDGQVLEVAAGPWAGVRAVRVETVASPSWVAWRELEVLSG